MYCSTRAKIIYSKNRGYTVSLNHIRLRLPKNNTISINKGYDQLLQDRLMHGQKSGNVRYNYRWRRKAQQGIRFNIFQLKENLPRKR
jgi:hypothetical protein